MRREATKHCKLACAVEVVGNSPSKLLRMSSCFPSFLCCASLVTLSPGKTPAGLWERFAHGSAGSGLQPLLMEGSKDRNYHENPLGDLPSHSSFCPAGNAPSFSTTSAGPRAGQKPICPFPRAPGLCGVPKLPAQCHCGGHALPDAAAAALPAPQEGANITIAAMFTSHPPGQGHISPRLAALLQKPMGTSPPPTVPENILQRPARLREMLLWKHLRPPCLLCI